MIYLEKAAGEIFSKTVESALLICRFEEGF